jgi:hypothetical protein
MLTAIEMDMNYAISFHIANDEGSNIIYLYNQHQIFQLIKNKEQQLYVEIPDVYLVPGFYFLNVWIGRPGMETYMVINEKIGFEMMQNHNVLLTDNWIKEYGLTYSKCKINII